MTRDDIDALISAGEIGPAAEALKALLRLSPQASTASFVVSRFESLAGRIPLRPLRIAFLRSFTIEPMIPLLRAHAYDAGIDLHVMLGDHNVIAQALLDPKGRLQAFGADVVVIASLTRDLAPALWHADGALDAAVTGLAQQVGGWIEAFRARSTATVIIQGLEQPPYAVDGLLDGIGGAGQREAIRSANQALAAIAARHKSVYTLDYDALVARHGRLAWSDAEKDLALRVPLRADAYQWLAQEYLRFLRPLAQRTCKVLAVDLDNTLWGGVVGEDGPTGIRIGVDYPGSAYLALQRELKALQRRGIVLAICSKNNPNDAMAVLRDHPEMLLRPEDFSAVRMNWEDKAANLRAIAAELNIGIDAVALLDDSPAERDWVRSQLPEVHVLEAQSDPLMMIEALRRSAVFERLTLSNEDRGRTAQYRQQQERSAAAAEAHSVEDFLRSLEMKATLDEVRPATLGRVAQLTQKTNQFNVTTRRYSEEEIGRFAADPQQFIRTIRVTDRYGDNGLVGLIMGRVDRDRCEIDTMLLSCRVIGRDVETALLADAAALARGRGAERLVGRFLATAKNAPASDVFARHGFAKVGE
ncbi:MAG TPA: HAD-IIIC family phosphatase, partial [Vicinamibacterales bacterium]